MIRKNVADVIKSMGFKFIDGKYQGKFMDDNTGDIIKIVTGIQPDTNGLPRLWFYAYNENDDMLGKCTLDQMLTDYSMHYMPIPEKSNKKYACTCSLSVQVPVDMSKINEETYYEHICSDIEIEIAREIGCGRIKDLFINNCMTVLDFNFDGIKEVE